MHSPRRLAEASRSPAHFVRLGDDPAEDQGLLLRSHRSGSNSYLFSTVSSESIGAAKMATPPTSGLGGKRQSVVSAFFQNSAPTANVATATATVASSGSSAFPDRLLNRTVTISEEAEATARMPRGFYATHAHLIKAPANSDADADRYFYRYPLSFYGPYFERLPRGLNHRESVHALQHTQTTTLEQTAATAGTQRGGFDLGGSASTVTFRGGAGLPESKTLAELCADSLGSSADFSKDWFALQSMNATTLTQIAAKMHALNNMAKEFATAVTPVAVKLVEERNCLSSQKMYKHLPSFDHVFVIRGNIFVVVNNPAMVQLYGSVAAAYRAAANELRAVRTALGYPFLGAQLPLCATIQHMGQTVFVSAPLSYDKSTGLTLTYGTLDGEKIQTEPHSTYISYKMGEFIPLVRHAVEPESNLNSSNPMQQQLFTACDVKQLYSKKNHSFVLLDSARWIPPAACHPEFSKNPQKSDLDHGKARHPLEDTPNAHLSVLFRPEFMREQCVVQLNGDAGCPTQHSSTGEAIGASINQVFSNKAADVAAELFARYQADKLQLQDIRTVFHSFGVNLRYMARVITELFPLHPKASEVPLREAVKKMLILEASARTWKTVVTRAIAETQRFKWEEDLVVQLMKGLLMTIPKAKEEFWDLQMKPVMMAKFGFYEVGALCTTDCTESVDRMTGKSDPNTLPVYHALNKIKIRVEKPYQPNKWKQVGGGFVALDLDAQARAAEEEETGTSALFPLLGVNAKENAGLMRRALELLGAEMLSDIRGKCIVVSFKPRVKPCTALIVSKSVDALFSGVDPATTIMSTIQDTPESEKMCEEVEAAAQSEILALSRIATSEPRQTLPLQLLAMSLIARGKMQLAYQVLGRWHSLRSSVPMDVISGPSALEIAPLFAQCHRIDRAEAALYDGLQAVRFAIEGVDLLTFPQWLFHSASIVGESVLHEKKIPRDRVCRVLEYLDYAIMLCEATENALLGTMLFLAAEVRRVFLDSNQCCNCHRKAALISQKHELDNIDRATSADHQDAGSAGGTSKIASTVQHPAKRGAMAKKRKAEEQKTEEDVLETFVKNKLDVISKLAVDAVSRKLLDIDTGPYTSGLLQGVVKPQTFVRHVRYLCDNCGSAVVDAEPIMVDPCKLFSRAVKLMQRSTRIRPTADSLLGEALVALGVLQGDASVICSGISDLSLIYGDTSRKTLDSEMQLAEVLISRSQVRCDYTESGSSWDIDNLIVAEDVLKKTLEKVLAKDAGPQSFKEYEKELNRVYSNYLRVTEIYSRNPVAKLEHNAVHYLATILPQKLGSSHKLVGSALGKITEYYIQLAKRFTDRELRSNDPSSAAEGASTALRTAGKFAIQWLKARITAEGAADDVASILHPIFCDQILKALRAGDTNDCRIASELGIECKAIVLASSYHDKPPVVASLAQIDDLFRSQLKVIEQSERTHRLKQEIQRIGVEMQRSAQRVHTHTNRSDRYCVLQVNRITSLRDEAKAIFEKHSKDSEIAEEYEKIAELHNTLLKLPSSSSASSATTESEQQQQARSESAAAGRKGQTTSSRLPYAFMTAPKDAPDDKQNEGGSSHRGLSSAPSGSGVAAAKQKRLFSVGSPLQQSSPGLGGSGVKTKETTEQLNKLLPRVHNSVAKKKFPTGSDNW